FGPRPENSVATLPGQIALTLIPYVRRSSAMHPVNPCRPHLDAQYRPPPANVFFPASELILIMSPRRRFIISGATALETRNTLFRFVSSTTSQSASLFSCTGPNAGLPIPALLTNSVIGP